MANPLKGEMVKARTVNNVFVLIILAAALALFKYSDELMRLFAGRQEVADLGVEILQPAIVGIIYVCIGVVFSTIMAAFVEPQLKENAFGTWSRFGIVFLSCFFGFCTLAAAIL